MENSQRQIKFRAWVYERNKLCEHQWDIVGECDLCGEFIK